MELREVLREARDSLSEHPRRVIASSMGVFWGAAAIIVLLAFGTGFREFMGSELSRYGKGCIFLYPATASSGFPGYRKGVEVEISRADIAAAERSRTSEVEAIVGEHISKDRVSVESDSGRVRRLDLTASDPRFASLRAFQIQYGRFYDADDVEARAPVAVLGPEAAKELFGRAGDAVGRTIRVDGHSFKVIGVTRSKGRQYFNTNRPDNRLLMIPAASAEARLGYPEERVSEFLIFPRPGVSAERAVNATFQVLGPLGGFHPDDHDAVKWFDTSQLLGLVDLFYAGFMVFVGAAGTVTLLIGGIGLANYHLATLAERTVELGVRKAIGAKNRTLVAQTIVESLLVSAGTAGLGALVGVAGCLVARSLIPPDFPIPILSGTVIGVTVSALVAVAVAAASIPAVRVRQVEVSAALRSTG